jgi:hypothetical protein
MEAHASYEFSEDQNLVIRNLAARLRLLGAAVLLLAVLTLAGVAIAYGRLDQPLSLLGAPVLACIYLLALGGPLVKASKGLDAVVETSHNDIDHVMDALGTLQRVFLINCFVVAALVIVHLLVLPAYVIPGG